jgi:hypothetical protein
MTNKPMLNAWNYSIIVAALQAKQRLLEGGLDAEQTRRHLRLVALGQDVVGTFERDGVHFPQIDLSYPPAAAAAPGSHVESRQSAAGNKLK